MSMAEIRAERPVHTASQQIVTRARAALSRALLAAVLSAGIAIVAGIFLAIPTLAESFGEGVTRMLPLPLFSTMLTLFGHAAKGILIVTIVVVGILFMAGIGALAWGVGAWAVSSDSRLPVRFQRLAFGYHPDQQRVATIVLLAILLWICEAGIIAPLLGGGFFGASFVGGIVGVFIAQLLPSVAFASIFTLLMHPGEQPTPATLPGLVALPVVGPRAISRRQLLRRGAIVLGVVVAGGLLINGVFTRIGALLSGGGKPPLQLGAVPQRIVPAPVPTYTEWSPVAGQTAEVTATADFYYVSKNIIGDPTVDSATWQLQINGLVAHPYAITYAQLMALPAVERYHTLECISNDIGGPYISTAFFRGVRLADVLNQAGIQSQAKEVIFHGADGYSDALRLDQVLDPRALVIYHINGAALPSAHGFPARLLIPGLYGMKNGKWLTGLELGAGGYTGYWEEQGWTREALVKIMARIDTPANGDLLADKSTVIAGIAYASDQGIARVEVSIDAGVTWQPAQLRRPLGPLTWTLWQYPWVPTKGQHIIAVRAITLNGTVQQPTVAPPLPNGASGYDAITVTVG